jgi:hypothetical protein
MRFLVDQDVYRDTIRFLRELGHDLVLAADLGMSRAPDERLLETALEQERILEDSLRATFMTVTAHGHRIRRLPS